MPTTATTTSKPLVSKKSGTPVKKVLAPKKPIAKNKSIAEQALAEKKPSGKVAKSNRSKDSAELPVKSIDPVKEKIKKPKLVRDSFSMPESEYAVLGAMKKACLKAGVEVKKSELLRIGVAMLQKTDVALLKQMLAVLPPLKAGRPKLAE